MGRSQLSLDPGPTIGLTPSVSRKSTAVGMDCHDHATLKLLSYVPALFSICHVEILKLTYNRASPVASVDFRSS